MIGSQLGVQGGTRIRFGTSLRIPDSIQHLGQTPARDHCRPVGARGLGFGRRARAGTEAGQQAHPFEQGHAVRTDLRLDLFPMLQDFVELPAIDLDPFALEQDQALRGFANRSPLGFGERFAIQRQVDLEVEQTVFAERPGRGIADSDLDLGPRRATGFPPIRDSDDDAALFEQGDLLQERVGLAGRPCLRMKNRPRIQQRPRQAALLRGALDRGQQARQDRAVPRAGVFLQSAAQWQMLWFALIGNPVGVGGKKREGMVRVAFVFREVERDPADDIPHRVQRLEVG